MSKKKISAGLLLCRSGARDFEFLLVHPGGPYFASKDAGAWSLPKGLIEPDEEPLDAALREFCEETGFPRPAEPYLALGEIEQKGGKRVIAFAAAGDAEPGALRSNTFELEWPPRSGQRRTFPEIDRAAWFDLAGAQAKLIPAQLPLLVRARAAWARVAELLVAPLSR